MCPHQVYFYLTSQGRRVGLLHLKSYAKQDFGWKRPARCGLRSTSSNGLTRATACSNFSSRRWPALKLLAHHWSALLGPVIVDGHIGVDRVDVILPGEGEQTSSRSHQRATVPMEDCILHGGF